MRKAKKWILLLAVLVFCACALCAALNILVDPYGVFSDPLLDWYAYDMTQNPGLAKVSYLELHKGEYTGFVIGSSSAASGYPLDRLGEALGADFYNLFTESEDLQEHCRLAEYAVRQQGAKQIVLCLGLGEAAAWGSGGQQAHARVTGQSGMAFYLKYALGSTRASVQKLLCWRSDSLLPQSFDAFCPQTGDYDRLARDAERIGEQQDYLEDYAAVFTAQPLELTYVDECVEAVRQIRQLCDENDVQLTVILSPVWQGRWAACSLAQLKTFRERLAEVTDYWNFACTSVSQDARYFYDAQHFRTAVGEMVLERMFGGASAGVPEDFGAYVTADTLPAHLAALGETPSEPETATIPVLMYHHLDEEASNSATVRPETFERHLQLLQQAGYETVSIRQLIGFVQQGEPLPEKAVLITFDDGYLSNYELAYPLLQQYGAKAAIFAIGSSVGHETYADTDWPITPHFSYEQAVEMMDSGLVEVQSHTYDLHQWAPYETRSPVRDSARQLEGEPDADYAAALRADLDAWAQEYGEQTGGALYALAWPKGEYSVLSEAVAHEAGVQVSFSTRTDRRNELVRGLPQTLYALCRLGVTEDTTDEELLAYLAGES